VSGWRVMAREWGQEGGLSLPLVTWLPLCGARCDAAVQRRLPERNNLDCAAWRGPYQVVAAYALFHKIVFWSVG